MTPKKKALEIVEDFTFNCRECDNSKISALIAINRMIDVSNDANMEFLEKVKQEIEAL
jgi:hypothetical protein